MKRNQWSRDYAPDHDFFMRELARAIGILRELPEQIDNASDEAKLRPLVILFERLKSDCLLTMRLKKIKMYHWASTILTEPEQADLAARINAELENRPPRFSSETWANQ